MDQLCHTGRIQTLPARIGSSARASHRYPWCHPCRIRPPREWVQRWMHMHVDLHVKFTVHQRASTAEGGIITFKNRRTATSQKEKSHEVRFGLQDTVFGNSSFSDGHIWICAKVKIIAKTMLRIIQFIANSQKICTFKSTNKNSNCPGGRLAKNPHSLGLFLLDSQYKYKVPIALQAGWLRIRTVLACSYWRLPI